MLLGGADAAQRKSNFELKDIYTINMPKGDTVCDKVAIKLGFSIYDEYIKGILINAYNILSYVVNDNVKMGSVQMNKIKKFFRALLYFIFIFSGITDLFYFIFALPLFILNDGFIDYILVPYIIFYNFLIEIFRGYILLY